MDGDTAQGVSPGIEFHPARPERLDDVMAVFGDCSYGRKCWCAYWYLPNREFKANWGEGNRHVIEDRIKSGAEPGIVGLVDGVPAIWLSIAPRTRFDRLNRSRPFAPATADDPRGIWAMNCFITVKRFRRRGLMRQAIAAGVDFVRERGGSIIEAYPFEANRKPLVDELFVGTAAAFRDLGFTEVARRLPQRPMRQLRLQP